jgi:uncharacterized protein (TIGR02996 family)
MRAALIAAIRELPDDDVPRLVAADWFEEQGGEANTARAEFIRTQIQRDNLPPDDIRQSELQAHELRLLKRWAPVWCGSHFVFKKVRFRRGFIEYVHLHLQHFLHHRRQMLELEPVRDIRLTGWFRAPDDLVRRVAGCAEWKYIETLRIHHQGPHHDPRSNLVELLESPHLSRLRALHCLAVQFDAAARRRFERLAILHRLTELHLPSLHPFPENPGEWFSDGGITYTSQWRELRSLSLPFYLRIHPLRQLTEMPFWNRLTVLDLHLPGHSSTPQALSILRDRMPEALQELRLHSAISPDDYSGADSFFQKLAQVSLQTLHLDGVPISPEILGCLLDGTNRWELRKLRLVDGDLNENHAHAIAKSPGVEKLRFLDLSGNLHFGDAAAQMLFASEHLRSLIHLNLDDTPVGSDGAHALASANGWERLRSLRLPDIQSMIEDMRKLLASRHLCSLVWLSLGGDWRKGSSSLNITPELAAEMSALPNLVCLYLNVSSCDARTARMFSSTDSISWVWIISDELSSDEKTFRAFWAPERWPPVADTWELGFLEQG